MSTNNELPTKHTNDAKQKGLTPRMCTNTHEQNWCSLVFDWWFKHAHEQWTAPKHTNDAKTKRLRKCNRAEFSCWSLIRLIEVFRGQFQIRIHWRSFVVTRDLRDRA